MLAIFLVGFLIFNDGVMTVISQASVFAKNKFSDGRRGPGPGRF